MSKASQIFFQFKQFTIAHDKCAMKVNTDGVLLGAWQVVNDVNNILDIGTGSGVIALMMAQKYSHALIDAVEIDEGAYLQAKQNFSESKWATRLKVSHCALQNLISDKKYDLIISNPPYFIDDFVSSNHRKNIAKHNLLLTYDDLVASIGWLMTEEGRALLVIPAFNIEKIKAIGIVQKLFINKLTEVRAVTTKKPYVLLLELGKKQMPMIKDSIAIQNIDGTFTERYKDLTKDFYLKF